MKFNIVDSIILAGVGALFVDLSLSGYHTNMAGLIIGGLLMLPGAYMAVHELWSN